MIAGSLWGQSSSASAPAATVEVRDVDFARVRDRAGDEWWEASVALRVVASRGEQGRYAQRVRIGFNVAFQLPNGTQDLAFYRAAVTSAVLEAGNHTYRFYLPPPIVERDRITSGARFWTVDLSVNGVPLPDVRDQIAPAFTSPAAVANFRTQLGQRAPLNDGVLLPWHYLPWGTLAGEADPAIIRPEAVGTAR